MDRRKFITLVTSITVAYPASALLSTRAQATSEQLEEPWQTITAVQEHLLPSSEHSPGASDIQALKFLRHMLETPDTDSEEKDFIVNGTGWLNDIARKNHSKTFSQLLEEDRESVLRQIELSQAGERWLSLLLTYLIEALLSDPVYGGNPDGIGWTWLEHQPGFPRPDTDKMYYRLGQPRYTRTKA